MTTASMSKQYSKKYIFFVVETFISHRKFFIETISSFTVKKHYLLSIITEFLIFPKFSVVTTIDTTFRYSLAVTASLAYLH